ncbi:hypothetical protein [Campylobacter canadensis]|uniref:Uncharacterized protein n=1 Tax=Campylobacter canadensis TaxID=449520 RepID=A0ABS7WRT7_9BACT|nr:hypothetical protein [Campylobacter canadensis]MBZ7987461.1 hypothetical protein [Campylobacter canadensis]MBZ7995358.1 hypothetical protein [Campylobacter canadensis]MBZ7996742.1 hypothetical protein [Campylobacter canadensis]MBZ7998656.1 hypothetical protein [Campylobacter canadensis]MBZ8000738.1 hypothetical protein [Campylobacter canadensis]
MENNPNNFLNTQAIINNTASEYLNNSTLLKTNKIDWKNTAAKQCMHFYQKYSKLLINSNFCNFTLLQERNDIVLVL